MTSTAIRRAGGKLVEGLRAKLGVPGLVLSADQLEEQLNATAQRADKAERNMSAALLNEANAISDNRQLRLDIAAAHERIAALEQQNEHLERLNRSGRSAISAVPENLRRAGAGVCSSRPARRGAGS